MSWQDDWRRQAWGWARRLDAIATGWLQLAQQGRMDSAAVKGKRELVLKVRGWIYEVIDRFLGGVEKLPNTVPLGALPHLIVGGVVVVTVASIGAWVSNEEARLVEAKRLFAQTVAEAAQRTDDPAVRQTLADLAGSVADKGSPLKWFVGGLALLGGL
ncbi:MAG: hypothetical protein KC583_03000, partial [Myxococcales bacterium]|nr:hypothetical protein [Myxococcales bacterium]